MSRARVPALIVLALVPPGLGAQASRPRQAPVRLVVHLAVDQFRPDYLERWGDDLPGGLGRLWRGGVVFLAGEQDHGVTETAPGHASMLSGRWPARTGIVSNDRGVGDPAAPLIGGGGDGASPHRFIGTTLYDWMRAADPGTRALSVSRKDRGAILPIGRAAVPVFWYARGRFTTSRWYGDSLPPWLQQWNDGNPAARLAGWSWEPTPGLRAPEADDRPWENGGRAVTFPHQVPTDPARAAAALTEFPVMDSLILDVAWRGVRAEGLGQRGTGHPDLLAISLSTTDAVGHAYGPGSLEIHDQVVRLDRYLGRFLDSLATVVPPGQMIVSLTADHGVQEYPEAKTAPGGRTSIGAEATALRRWARDRWGIDVDTDVESGLLLADVDALRARGVNVARLADSMATRIRALAGVKAVYTPASLARLTGDEVRRWRHQVPASGQWLVAASLEPGWMWATSPNSTTHGSTNLLDRRVPIIVMAPGLAAQRSRRVVGVADLAPTLAALLGVTPTEPLDGTPLVEVVPRQR